MSTPAHRQTYTRRVKFSITLPHGIAPRGLLSQLLQMCSHETVTINTSDRRKYTSDQSGISCVSSDSQIMTQIDLNLKENALTQGG